MRTPADHSRQVSRLRVARYCRKTLGSRAGRPIRLPIIVVGTKRLWLRFHSWLATFDIYFVYFVGVSLVYMMLARFDD